MLIHPAPVRQEFQDLYNSQAEALQGVLEEGIASKEVRMLNTGATARIIYDMTRGFIAQRLLGWSKASVDQDAGTLFDVIWRGVGCQGN
jgi:hypothetical protein